MCGGGDFWTVGVAKSIAPYLPFQAQVANKTLDISTAKYHLHVSDVMMLCYVVQYGNEFNSCT